MKLLFPAALAGLLALSGCARNYVLKLNNGATITTASKPRLQDGSWRFKDAKGEDHYVPSGSVREVAPASAVSKETKPQPVKGPPRKRHWYLLWLG